LECKKTKPGKDNKKVKFHPAEGQNRGWPCRYGIRPRWDRAHRDNSARQTPICHRCEPVAQCAL